MSPSGRFVFVLPLLLLSLPGCQHLLLLPVPHQRGRTTVRTAPDAQPLLFLRSGAFKKAVKTKVVDGGAPECGQKL